MGPLAYSNAESLSLPSASAHSSSSSPSSSSTTSASSTGSAARPASPTSLPYRPISQLFHSRFGEKVYKIPVSLAETCPNREGLKGMQTCTFCDEWGSAARKETLVLPLNEQIEKVREQIRARFRANKFLVYFQSYTNTFLRLQKLDEAFRLALQYPDVVGLINGTRPDCISKGVLDLWERYAQETFLSIEMGVQSINDQQLLFLRRGHTWGQSLQAIEKIAQLKNVDLGIHLMFGLPGETDEQIIQTARVLSALPIHHVKLHNLHVLTNTPLEELYKRGEFTPITLELYAHRVSLFLRHLRPDIAIDRLNAVASRWDELVAPDWTRLKMAPHQFIVDTMNNLGARQGDQYFGPWNNSAPTT